jgi:hypothetical protein
MYSSLLLATATCISLRSTAAQNTSSYSPSTLATSLEFSQAASSLPFPDTSAVSTYANTTNNATAKYIRREWDLYNQRIQWGQPDLQFVQDPDTSVSDEDLVLRVDYPEGSYSHATGGTQFYVSLLSVLRILLSICTTSSLLASQPATTF